MEQIKIYAVWDRKSERFDTPYFAFNDLFAKRRFIMMCEEPKSTLARFKKDFELYSLGTFSVLKGEIVYEKKLVIDGIQVEKEKEDA